LLEDFTTKQIADNLNLSFFSKINYLSNFMFFWSNLNPLLPSNPGISMIYRAGKSLVGLNG
jgi:hypothetical protein